MNSITADQGSNFHQKQSFVRNIHYYDTLKFRNSNNNDMIFKVFVRELLPVAPFSFEVESDWRGIHLNIKYKIKETIINFSSEPFNSPLAKQFGYNSS